LAAFILLLAGCRQPVAVGDTDPPACTNAFTAFPAADSVGTYYRGTVEAHFQTIDESARLTVVGARGSQTWADNVLVFTPDAPFSSSTTYMARVEFECGSSEWEFTTSDVGPVVNADLIGRTYDIDLYAGRWHPRGFGDLIEWSFLSDLMVEVVGVDGDRLILRGATTSYVDDEDVVPSTCFATADFEPADFSQDPYFAGSEEEFHLALYDGLWTPIHDMALTGAFAADGSRMEGLTLEGTIDTRPLAPLLPFEPDEDEVCMLAQTMSSACVPCGDGSGDFCLPIHIDSLPGRLVEASIPAIEPADIDCAVCGSVPACR
jgi:hypothetical protein